MTLPSDTPRLPKWIFLLGDAALLAAAWFVADRSEHPTTGMPLVAIVACVALAAVIGAIPFVADYARRQDEALDNRQRSLHALSVTVAATSEQVSIAATGLQGIAEAAQENFSKSESLSHHIQEKIAELDERLAKARKDDSEAAARLESVAKKLAELDERLAAAKKDDGESAARLESAAKKIAKAAAEFDAAALRAAEAARAIPAAAPMIPSAPPMMPVVPTTIPEVPPVIASRIAEIRPAVSPPRPPVPVAVAAAPEPAAPAAEPPPAAARVPEAATEPVTAPAAEPAVAPPAPPPRKRSPRKHAPLPEELPTRELVLESPAADSAPAPAATPAGASAVSGDGATRVVVTAYIGIGNRLFIRGDGPGLSWEKGVPLTFVSIGKWRWEATDASAAVRFKLYKNDETECTALGERSVDSGAQLEITASF